MTTLEQPDRLTSAFRRDGLSLGAFAAISIAALVVVAEDTAPKGIATVGAVLAIWVGISSLFSP